MPELPEVEIIARGLQQLTGRRIVGTDVRWERSVSTPEPGAFMDHLQGRQILRVSRRGKWVHLLLEGSAHLLIHLRMSGRLLVEPADAPTGEHTRVLLLLDDDRRLRFSDPRKFGRMILTADADEVLGELGPEPLAEDFTPEQLGKMLADRRARLKSLLLNQRFLAGLGNIYTNEVLWRAKLHPLRRADTLSAQEVDRLHAAIQNVLKEAIARRGTTLSDERYVGVNGEPGDFAQQLAAYGRAGEPCPRCGSPVVRIVVGQRGTYICRCCQPEDKLRATH